MQRVLPQSFYRLATCLRPLETIAAGLPILDQFAVLWSAQRELHEYLVNDPMPPMASAHLGWALHSALKELTDSAGRDEPVTCFEESNIKSLLTRFENNLEVEYATKNLFIVSPKGIYSTTDLIERTERAFSREVRDRIPDAIHDLKQAGRCIAFEVPTAAAFHIFRAVEAVARLYVTEMRGVPPTDEEKRAGLGRFVEILNANGADSRVISAISQLVKLHRNPTMHPEIFITNAEVLITFGMAQSVIQSIVADMETKHPRPSPEVTSPLPDPKDLAYEKAEENQEEPASPDPVDLAYETPAENHEEALLPASMDPAYEAAEYDEEDDPVRTLERFNSAMETILKADPQAVDPMWNYLEEEYAGPPAPPY